MPLQSIKCWMKTHRWSSCEYLTCLKDWRKEGSQCRGKWMGIPHLRRRGKQEKIVETKWSEEPKRSCLEFTSQWTCPMERIWHEDHQDFSNNKLRVSKIDVWRLKRMSWAIVSISEFSQSKSQKSTTSFTPIITSTTDGGQVLFFHLCLSVCTSVCLSACLFLCLGAGYLKSCGQIRTKIDSILNWLDFGEDQDLVIWKWFFTIET